ncbi:amidohydrolase family protein [Gordonia amicalis]|uniref:amidohydrolase family protein n=1 Tax=Gordonia amicalis TaxID=89053 RepID=UPI0024BB22D7|nr:amidohydrolase family protein [Gordonia amicalis]MDJ0454678.1 amidohydrolase family protein [Gordonia amicalis]MDV7077973.1 amidohydrolase family protein [Gordonia amicalis]
MSPIVLAGAEAVLVDGGTVSRGPVVVDGAVIASGPGPSDAEVVDTSGCVITPGLVNAHHHLLQSAFRSRPDGRFLPMRDWLARMARRYTEAAVDPELTAAAAGVGVAESLLCGVTTVADHHLTWPRDQDPVAMAGATIGAARRLGGRIVFVRGTARDDPDAAAQSVVDIHDAHQAGATDGVSPDGLTQLAVGPSGVHADGPETFAALSEVAARLGLRRRTQANEQIDVEIAAERYGRRPLELLDDWGWLAADVTVAHLCEITDDELDLVARSGAHATHAPGCDVPMGWGVARVAALGRAGVRIGLGTSGGGSNDAGHLLADARLAMQVSGLIGDPVSARDCLAMATEGSATGLGRPELGHLRPGAAADLCVWDCSDVFDAGVPDALDGLLWAGPGRRPRDVMVGGRWVVRDGVLVTADSRALANDLTTMLDERLSG